VLRLTISETGTVSERSHRDGEPAFDAPPWLPQAIRLHAGGVDGKPAAIRILYRYEFTLKVEKPKVAVFSGVVRDRTTRCPCQACSCDSTAD